MREVSLAIVLVLVLVVVVVVVVVICDFFETFLIRILIK